MLICYKLYVSVVLYGLVAIGMAFLAGNLGGTVLQMSITFNGSVGAPLMGIFLLGAFFPCVNAVVSILTGISSVSRVILRQ